MVISIKILMVMEYNYIDFFECLAKNRLNLHFALKKCNKCKLLHFLSAILVFLSKPKVNANVV